MENIQGMLEEIRGVVQNHFQDENKKITETISVLNNLPIVIALRKQVEELTKINTQLQEFLKMHDDRENIELEIVELEKNGSLEKKLIPDFFAEAAAASDGDQEDMTGRQHLGQVWSIILTTIIRYYQNIIICKY